MKKHHPKIGSEKIKSKQNYKNNVIFRKRKVQPSKLGASLPILKSVLKTKTVEKSKIKKFEPIEAESHLLYIIILLK
jgi:hypothetical protein